MRAAVALLLVAFALFGAARWPTGSAIVADTAGIARLQHTLDSIQADLDRSARNWAQRTVAANTNELWRSFEPPAEQAMVVQRAGRSVFWQGHVPLSDAELARSGPPPAQLLDGTYLYASGTVDSNTVHLFRQLLFVPPVENDYLVRGPMPGLTFPAGHVVANDPAQGSPLYRSDGSVLFSMALGAPNSNSARWQRGALALALLVGLLGLARLASTLRHNGTAIASFVLPIVALRAWALSIGPGTGWGGAALFDPSNYAASRINPSLGDLLLNASLLLACALFLRFRWQQSTSVHTRLWQRLALLAPIFLAGRLLGGTVTSVVRDSRNGLDLFHMESSDSSLWWALAAISILLVAWIAIARSVARRIGPAGFFRSTLPIMVLLTGLLMLADHLQGRYDLLPALWPLALLLPLFLLRTGKNSFHGAMLLVGISAFFTAHLLNRATLARHMAERTTLAELATTREDPVVELLYAQAMGSLIADPQLHALLAAREAPSPTALDRLTHHEHFCGYWERYEVRLHVYDAQSRPIATTSPDAIPTLLQMNARLQQGAPSAINDALRYVHRPQEEALYLASATVPGTGHVLFVEVRPRLLHDGLGFPELLLAGERSAERRLENHVRARYERGVLAQSAGNFRFPIHWREPVPADGMELQLDGYDLLAWGDLPTTLVVIGRRTPGLLEHFTTFSYLFTWFALIALLCYLLLPALDRSERLGSGIVAKQRTGILLFAAVSLLLFLVATRYALDTRSAERSARAWRDRGNGIINELQRHLGADPVSRDTDTAHVEQVLIHTTDLFYTDISLYATDGGLVASSREQMFNTGLLGRRMQADAYRAMAQKGRAIHTQEEQLGKAVYRATYMPYRNERGDVTAYLAMPYFARQAETERERAAGNIAVVNLFTVLFALSGLVAALISQWTTRPLHVLRDGLERIGLGQRNEPLVYPAQDELGELVSVYNRKVEELRASAEKLAHSERETAWKEMARQVAHEIKNPLTPMKLNIQHFQRTWTPDAPDARAKLDRFSNNLVEQIDVLSRIAGEFSHFAQMPPAHPAVLDLAEVAEATVQLFAQTPGVTISFHSTGPLIVLADREHLLRSFNNLLKNAIQSIPDGRSGSVEVILRAEDGEALVEVRDNGTGIPAHAVDHVFQPKFTTKSSGMGLGLALVKRMVENASGRVWFSTEEGVGTRFFVALPLRTS